MSGITDQKSFTSGHTGTRVTVIIMTYNHERYIAEALMGVLGQKTSFNFEIVVTEDCSTDSTKRILMSFARRHPDRIRLLFSDTNLRSKRVIMRALAIARGEYISILDGDDFWTVENKLQKQVEFLDEHPECSLCFHDVNLLFEDIKFDPARRRLSFISTFDDIIRGNFIPTCSALVRRSAIWPVPDWYRLTEFGDWALWVLASLKGQLAYLDEVMATYRIHSRGKWSSLDKKAKYHATIRLLSVMERGLGANYVKQVHSSRAVFRRQLIAQLDAEREYWSSIRETAKTLWAERFAYSTRRKIGLGRDIIIRSLAQMRPNWRRRSPDGERQAPQESAATSNLDYTQ